MPTYEYRCSECGNQFEIFQRIDEEHLTVCERCGGRLRKLFHPAGIVFKGSGFYATDSRSKAKSASKDQGERDASKSGDRSETTETKTKEKTETKKPSTSSESSS